MKRHNPLTSETNEKAKKLRAGDSSSNGDLSNRSSDASRGREEESSTEASSELRSAADGAYLRRTA